MLLPRPELAPYLLACLLAFMCVQTKLARADSGVTDLPVLDLGTAERLAVERDRSLASLEAQADALAERAIADGQLPDPELTFGYQDLPTRSFPTTDDMMTMLMVGVRQQVPPRRTRALRRDHGETISGVRRAERDEWRLQVLREVRRAWLDWRLAHASLALAGEALADLEELMALTERRVAAGTAHSRELLQARLERAAFSERVIELESERAAAAAELGRWVGESAAGYIPGRASDWPAPAEEDLRERLPSHPALTALEQQRLAGQVAADLARQAYRPEWMFELGYGYRRGTDMATGASRSDLVTGMVSVTLPLFTAQRQDRQLAAAQRELDAAAHDQGDVARRLQADLERHWVQWERLDELVRFYHTELLPEAEEVVVVTRNAYRSDLAPFDELIRAQVNERDYQLRALGIERQRSEARIGLLYLAGE